METISQKVVGNNEREPLLGPGISGGEILLVRLGGTVRKLNLEQLKYVWQDAQVLGLSPSDWQDSWKNVTGFLSINNVSHSVRLRTRCRRQIVLSPLHDCLTVGDDGELVMIKAEHLQPGRSLIPLARRIPGPYPIKLPIHQDLSLNPHGRRPKYTIKELPLTRNFGFFLGRYLANGSTENDAAIAIANIHPALTEKTVAAATRLGLKSHVSDLRIRISSTQLARILKREFGAGAAKKKIPGWVFGASPAFREGLLDGYWSHAWISGDGMQVKACTDSKELGFDMQALLLSMGIQSSCREWYYIKKHTPTELHYIIELAASSIGRMPLLTHPDRRTCQSRWHPPQKDMLCVLPIPQKLVRGKLRDKSSKGFGGFSFVSREATHPKHLEMITGDLLWDIVVSIEEDLTSRTLCQIQLEESATPVLFSGIGLVGHLSLDL